MIELKKDTLDLIKQERVSVLLVYMDGCAACQMVKGPFEDLSKAFPNISCFKGNLGEVSEFYLQFADENPNVIDEATGKPAKKVVAPMFYVFVKEEQSEENPWGWVGGIDGADINSLAQAMGALNE
jgi:hypothetical protein